jgi:hypothetical protein
MVGEVGHHTLTVARTAASLTLAFPVTIGGPPRDANSIGGSDLWFASTDCTGPPFFRTDDRPPIQADAFVLPAFAHATTEALTLYYPSGASSSMSFGSRLYFDTTPGCGLAPGETFEPPDGCCITTSGTIEAAPAASVDLAPVTPPFRVSAP